MGVSRWRRCCYVSYDTIMPTAYLTTHQVARLLDMSPGAILTWIDAGTLPAFRTPGGHRRVPRAKLVRFLRDHGMPLPRELAIRRILIVDDDQPFLRSTARLLRHHVPGLELETADSAPIGLLKVGTFRPDAVLLDAYMPGMDGIEACRLLRSSRETEDIAVVAVTGRPSAEIEKSFAKAGALATLTKPLDVPMLAELLGVPTAAQA